MLTYNNNHIFTGYLKQLLADFNIPNYRIYTVENALEHQRLVEELKANPNKKSKRTESLEILETGDERLIFAHDFNVPGGAVPTRQCFNYIKDNKIQRYMCTYDNDGNVIADQWIDTHKHFHYTKKVLNETKSLLIKNNNYDSYTHEYLGDFLRFQRDFNHIDLMPLYNCFSDNICLNLNLNFNLIYSNILGTRSEEIIFDSRDSNYKIYMVPVKLFKKYTIAIDCSSPVEMCCGIYKKYQNIDVAFAAYSYRRYSSLQFNSPILYDCLTVDKMIDEVEPTNSVAFENIAQKEKDLKLFIKLPISNTSTITILEGDYLSYNQNYFGQNWFGYEVGGKLHIRPATSTAYAVDAMYVTNWDESKDLPKIADRPFIPITNLQLLALNTKVSHPFADRLIEYLVGNVITSAEDLSDNIKRVQTVMQQNGHNFSIYGAWEEKIRRIAYDYMNRQHSNNITQANDILKTHDCLGYIDKDIEKFYTGWELIAERDANGNVIPSPDGLGYKIIYKKPLDTISSVDLYEDLYK